LLTSVCYLTWRRIYIPGFSGWLGDFLETVSITGKKITQNLYEKQATIDKKHIYANDMEKQQKLQHCRTRTKGLLDYDLRFASSSLLFIRMIY
jgi:hypothetical protein